MTTTEVNKHSGIVHDLVTRTNVNNISRFAHAIFDQNESQKFLKDVCVLLLTITELSTVLKDVFCG